VKRQQPKPQQRVGLRLVVAGLAGFDALTQGLMSMTSDRGWQWVWLLAAASTTIILTLMSQSDLGVLSKILK
jgi:hypothetical protein